MTTYNVYSLILGRPQLLGEIQFPAVIPPMNPILQDIYSDLCDGVSPNKIGGDYLWLEELGGAAAKSLLGSRWECLRAKALAGVEWGKSFEGHAGRPGKVGGSVARRSGTSGSLEIPHVIFRDDVSEDEFIIARDKSKKSPFLSKTTAEEFRESGTRLSLSLDGKTGYGVTRDGDVVNVFNNGGPKGAGTAAVMRAISEGGGRTLDCFAGHLPTIYSQVGFAVTGRIKFNDEYAPEGWDYKKYDRPNVLFMAWQDGDRKEVRVNYGKFKRYIPRAGKRFTDFGQGKAASQSATSV